MKSCHIALLIPVFLALLAPAILAQGFAQLKVVPQNLTVDIFTPVKYTVYLTNMQKNTSFFSVFAKILHPEWATFEKTSLDVGFNQTASFAMNVLPTNDIGDFAFEIIAEYAPRENITERISSKAYLTVSTPEKVLFKDFKVYQFGNRIELDTFIKSLEVVPIEAVFDLYNRENMLVKTVVKQIESYQQKRITEVVDFGDLEAGNYNVKAYVRGTSIRVETKFNVKTTESVSMEKKIIPKFLSSEISIRVINNGNDVVSDYRFSEEVEKTPPVTLISLVTTPVKKEEKNSSFVYEFSIPPLRPGESTTVIYIVEEWPNTLLSILLLVLAASAVVYAFFWMKNPKIKKRYVRQGKGACSIIIEVKNSLLHDVADATVRDWVSPMAKVEHIFEGGVKPAIRESHYGTEIIWKFGPMKRGEQRAVSYTIKTVFHGASLRMPRAYIRYLTEGRRGGKATSNELEIRP